MEASETRGLVTLIAPSNVLNHWGRVLHPYLGKWRCNPTIAIEVNLKVYSYSMILARFLTIYPSLTKKTSNLLLILINLCYSFWYFYFSYYWNLILSGGSSIAPDSKYFWLILSCYLVLILMTDLLRSIKLTINRTASLRNKR